MITYSLVSPHLCLADQSARPRFVPVFSPNKSVLKSRVVTVSSNQPRSRGVKSNQDVSLESLVLWVEADIIYYMAFAVNTKNSLEYLVYMDY